MFDLCALAEKIYFHPYTKGSNSIKKVLPAVLQSSDYLKSRYSKPIYGAQDGIPSKNFTDKIWWEDNGGTPKNPYDILQSAFADLPIEDQEKLKEEDYLEVTEGGAATTAYGRLQFEQLDPDARVNIQKALLKYCELDTLAMVMVYEAWREWSRS